MAKTKHSYKDAKGRLWVACCECTKGGNGKEDCSSGWKCKKWNFLGCFLGEVLPELEFAK